MTSEQTIALLSSIARLGVGIAAGVTPVGAGSFALGAVIREAPHIIDLAATVLATGQLTDEQKTLARSQATALKGGLANIPAADAPPVAQA